MKKMLLAVLGVLAIGGLAYADSLTIKAPVTDKGVAASPFYAGFKYYHMTGTTEVLVCSHPCVLVDLILSTGPQTAYVKIKDTATIGSTTAEIEALPDVNFQLSTESRHHVLSYPIRSVRGFTMDMVGVSNGNDATAIFMDLD